MARNDAVPDAKCVTYDLLGALYGFVINKSNPTSSNTCLFLANTTLGCNLSTMVLLGSFTDGVRILSAIC